MNIGDLFLGLKVDPSGELKSQVTKAAKEAGDAGGKTLGEHLAMALKGASVLIAGGLALATKGAMEAERAQGAFMSATGKSREEAKKFVSGMDSLAGSAGTVGKSFEDIAATGTMVEQQFGTTGQATTDLTGQILEFAKVTGQDAEQAAADLEDTLSAFGLGAEDAAGLMDKLKASSQTFGTDAGPAAIQALKDMAPALDAMGMQLGDGIEFLNAFEVAGGNAGDAAAALNKSIKTLKPGQDVDDLIAQVGSIEDPLLRSKKATELFGKAAGPGMALLIKPGMTSLDDFGVSAEDAAGSVHRAADNMLTFNDRIQGFIQKGLAGLREVGQEFGPAVTALGSMGTLFGPAIAKSIGAGWEMAGKSTTVQNAITNASAAMSGNLGTALRALGVVAVGAALVDIWLEATAQTKEKIANNPNAITPTDMFQMRAPMWAGAKLAVAKQMQDLGQSALAAFNAEWDKGIAAGMSPSDPTLLAAAKAAGATAGTTAGASAVDSFAGVDPEPAAGSFADGLSSSGSWADAGNKAATTISGAFAVSPEWVDASRTAALKITDAFNDKVLSERGQAQDAWTQFVNMMKHPLDTAAELAELKGELASKKMAKGLASNDPQVRTWAENTRDSIQSRINDLEQLLAEDGTNASTNLKDHLNDGYPGAIADARTFVDSFNAQLAHLKSKYNISINTAGNRFGEVGMRASGGRVERNKPYIVGEHRAEWFVPEQSGYVYPRVPGGTSGASTYNISIPIYDATDPQKVGDVVAGKLERIFRSANVQPLNRSARPAF